LKDTEEKPVIVAMPDTEPTDVGHGWLDRGLGMVDGVVHTGWLPYAVAAALLVLLAVSIVSRRKRGKPETEGAKQALTRTDRLITRATGVLATAVVATGAWKVFGLAALDLNPVFRVVLFFFAEAQVVAAWRRVRRHIHRHAELGPGVRTIYGIALGSATVAAFDASALVEVLLRFFAAFVAAYMIAEELAEELDIYLEEHPHKRTEERKKAKRGLFGVKWALTPERIMVWLRLAEPSERTVEQVERQRRVARMARTAHRLQTLKAAKAQKWRIGWARRSLRRQTEQANEHLDLAGDPDAIEAVRTQLALLFEVEDQTTREAVADASPLRITPTTPDITTGQADRPEADTEADAAADRTTDTPALTGPDSTPANAPDPAIGHEPFTAVDIATGLLGVHGSGHAADMRPVNGSPAKTLTGRTPRRPARRTPNPTSKWTKDQLKAFRLRDNRPDMTYPMIAREVGVSEKTVSRWFKARQDADTADNDPDSERAERVIPAPLVLPISEPKALIPAGVTNGRSPTPEEP
jgi:hypothetical protein